MRYDSTGYSPDEYKAVPPGDYPFTVTDATEEISRNGNEMIALVLAVTVPGREKALKIFEDHGADVDRDTCIVKIPPDLVDKALETAPRNILLGGREPRFDLLLDGSRSYLTTDGCGLHVIDLETREKRSSRKSDVAMMARVGDAIPFVSFFWPMVSAQDHGLTAPLHECHAGLMQTADDPIQSETAFFVEK